MSDDHELEQLEPGIERTMSFGYECVSPEHEADILECLCEGYTRANQIMIRAQENAYPCCLGCGNYRYVPPSNCVYDFRSREVVDRNCQAVLGAAALHRKRKGTCIDLACMLAAIYREKEGDALAKVIIDYQFDEQTADAQGGEIVPGKYHAMVKKGDGTIVDPQAQLEALAAKQAATELAFDEQLSVGESCGCRGLLPPEQTSHVG